MKTNNIKIKTLNKPSKGLVKVKIEFEVISDKYDTSEYIGEGIKNNEWLIQHLVEYRPWSSNYDVRLFCDALTKNGEYSIHHGHCVNSVKYGRRAIAAANMLRIAYGREEFDDKSCDNHNRRIKHEMTNVVFAGKRCRQMKFLYPHSNAMGMDPEEYSKKMGDVISRRVRKAIKEEKASAWAFINKYIDHWWD